MSSSGEKKRNKECRAPYRCRHGVPRLLFLGLQYVYVYKPIKYVTHDQRDAEQTVTFPAAERHRSFTCTKSHCMMTVAQGCRQVAISVFFVNDDENDDENDENILNYRRRD